MKELKHFTEMVRRMKKGQNLSKTLLRKVNREQLRILEDGMVKTAHLHMQIKATLEQEMSRKDRKKVQNFHRRVKTLMRKEAKGYQEILDVAKEIERL